MYKDILTKEELEALLSPEELDAFKSEQQSRLEHELMLSPAHLLLAIRELQDIVTHLNERVEHLEGQAMPHHNAEGQSAVAHHNTAAPEPEYNQANEFHAASEYQLDATANKNIPDLSELISQTMPELLPAAMPEPFAETTPKIEIQLAASTAPGSLMSRSERHRERKPSLLSKLLK